MKHLQGTPFEAIAKNHSYVTDATGFVAMATIDHLRRILGMGINLCDNPVAGRLKIHKSKIQGAIDAMKKFGSDHGK